MYVGPAGTAPPHAPPFANFESKFIGQAVSDTEKEQIHLLFSHATHALPTCRFALSQSFQQLFWENWPVFKKGTWRFPAEFGNCRRKLDPSLWKMVLFAGNLTRSGGGNLRETSTGNLALFRRKL